MKKFLIGAFALFFAASLAHAETLTLKPGQTKTLTLPEAYFSSQNGGKAVAYSSGRGGKKVTIHAQRAGSTSIAFFNKKGGLIENLNVQVGNEAHASLIEEQEEAFEETHARKKQKKSKKTASKPAASSEPRQSYNAWSSLKQLFPNESFQVQQLGSGLALTGTVSDAATAAHIVEAATQVSGGKQVLNMMQLKSGQQVMLRVRIGEVQRGAMDQLGLSAQGVVGTVSGLFYSSTMHDMSTRLDFLSQNGLMKVLAEPNLTAISGEKATFLAGGEFPIPVPQKGGDVFTVEYKPFGVGINFTPTVLSGNRIRLAVEPEVSELSGGSVKFNGSKIPSLSTRRAKTTVELAPGESFMIAGLISDNMKNLSDEMPLLGDIPVLGALFRSTAFQRNETELVIAVTPYLVEPVPSQEIKLPSDRLRAPGVWEQTFFGAIAGNPNVLGVSGSEPAAQPAPAGNHGFISE